MGMKVLGFILMGHDDFKSIGLGFVSIFHFIVKIIITIMIHLP